MASSRPPHAPRPPRPTMHADIPNKWLWCDDNAKVTKWYMNLPNRPRYSIFVSSFINNANKAWEKAIDPLTKMSPLDRDMVQCLLKDPISTETMIKTLTTYNDFIGGGREELKQLGLISWNEESLKDAAIEKGSEQLYKLIEKTMHKYHKAEAIRASSMNTGKGKNKNKGNGKGNGKAKINKTVNNQADEDEQTLVSLDDMGVELTKAGNTSAAIDHKGKLKNPVNFGELPYVGGKKGKDVQEKKDDSDEE